MKTLLVLGSINQDYTLKINNFPKPGETIDAKNYQLLSGGKGANQAVAVGRCGAAVKFIAAVGEDETGHHILQQLEHDNVNTEAIAILKGEQTGIAIVLIDAKGENSIVIFPGANACLTPEHVTKYQNLIAESSALLMQLEIPLETVLATAKFAKQLKKKIIINPAPAQQLPDELLNVIDVITPNQTEAEILTGIPVLDEQSSQKAADILHKKGINTVIITLGKQGVWFSEQGKGKRLAAFQVDAIDTVAAGDTFMGLLLPIG
jgi:ribokinase